MKLLLPSVVTWGDAWSGGDSEKVKPELTGGVEHVVATTLAFAALKEDGSIVTWGDADFGGNSDAVKFELQGGVRHVVGNGFVFAAVKEDDSVVRAEQGVEANPTWSGAS